MFAVALVAPVACGDSDDESSSARGALKGLPGVSLEETMSRVEALRGLEFKRTPKVEVLGQELLEERLEDAGRARVRKDPDLIEREERAAAAEEALLFLLGVIDTKSDVQRLGGSDDLELGGVYIPEQDRVYLVREAVRKDREEGEKVLAHELTHALEDQHFGLEQRGSVLGDKAGAIQALGEGSATVVEVAYVERHQSDRSAGTLLDRREQRAKHADVPPGLRPALLFPYLDGAGFVRSLRRAGGRAAVDRGFRRTPATTEQILHPQKWIEGEQAAQVEIPRAVKPSGAWRRLAGGDVGELSTRVILATSLQASAVNRAAAGWGGGAYRTWYRGGLPTIDCRRSCRKQAVAVLTWSWDDEREAREFDGALERFLRAGLRASPAGERTWALAGGAAATAARGNRTTLVLAPEERLASQLARRSLQKK
jgi:hypothetical protein